MSAEDALLWHRSGVGVEEDIADLFDVCPKCDGDGFLLVEHEETNAVIVEIRVECDDCSGRGTVT